MNITWEVVAAVITVLGFVSGIWWRVEGMIRKNTDDLAAHKLHVAETYTTKASLAEQTQQIMRAIESLGDKIDRMDGRIDGVMKAKTTPRSRTQ